MYALRCRSCVGRRVPHLVSFARSNSTASSPDEPVPKPISSARIASSLGDIIIPSREEILNKNLDSYKPDLSYLASRKSSSIASRLAAHISSSSPDDQSSAEAAKSLEEKNLRIQALTAARKAERAARDHAELEARNAAKAAQAAARAAREAEKVAKEAAAQRSVARAALLTDERRAERLRREASMTPRQRLAIDSSLTEIRPQARTEPRRRREPPKTTQQNASKPMRPKKPTFRIQTMPSQDAALAQSKEDITLEIIEDGGDEKEPPQFTYPDVPFTNLQNLFEPSISSTLREAYAGDYQRIAPQTSQDYVTPPHQLGPLKHAKIVLSHRSDVSIAARENALAIISRAVGGATGATTVPSSSHR